jgi:hypothetical protein
VRASGAHTKWTRCTAGSRHPRGKGKADVASPARVGGHGGAATWYVGLTLGSSWVRWPGKVFWPGGLFLG